MTPQSNVVPGLIALLGLTVVTGSAQQSRPAITGVSHMSVYSADAAASEHFYT
jgi:hypothetical protein